MRTLEEVDADIAETKRQIELGNAFNRRAARFDYILGGDRSGLDAIGQAVNNALERERQQKFQNSQVLAQQEYASGQADLQRKFQAEEAEKQRKFQGNENNLMRQSQEKIRQDDLYLERAKALHDIADARAVYDDTKKKRGPKTLDFARAGNMLRLQIANGRKLGIDADKLNEIDPDYIPNKEETSKDTTKGATKGGKSKTPQSNGNLGDDQSAESTANDTINKIQVAKTVSEVNELLSSLPFGNDATNTEQYQKVKTAADKRIKELSNAANKRAELEETKGLFKKQWLNSGEIALARAEGQADGKHVTEGVPRTVMLKNGKVVTGYFVFDLPSGGHVYSQPNKKGDLYGTF